MADSRIDELRRRLERDPGSRLFAQLAEEFRKAGEVEEAVSVARAGLELHPTYASARLTLGRALLDSGDPAGARVELEAAVREAPDNILASRLLGEALETLGDLGSALVRYRATLEMAAGDRHVEARVRAIQERLGAGGGPAGAAGAGDGEPQEVTKPMAPVRPGGEPAKLPPTVRIRMPADGVAQPRAPLPPTASGARDMRRPAGAAVDGAVEGAWAPGGAPGPASGIGDELPPTLPLGMRTNALTPEGPAGGAGGPAVAPAGTDTADVGEAATEVPGRSARSVRADAAAPATDVDVAPETPRPPGVVPGPEVPADPAQSPLSSATLGELYFQQGLLERAVEVYRQVLDEEPGNDPARRRLGEIESLVRESAEDLPVEPSQERDGRAARRQALERAIARLEALLAVVRRRR